MFVLIYAVTFMLLCLIFFTCEYQDDLFVKIRIAFIKAMVCMALFTVVITEVLSYFNILSLLPVLCAWSLAAVGVVVMVFRKKNVIKKNEHCSILSAFNGFDKAYIKALAVSIFLIIGPLFFLALFYPPNNSDSLGYHLPRIEHWMQNCSVRHYLTSDLRQLYTPPLPEFIGLHLRLLSGGDLWLNMIQFLAMIGCLFLVSLAVRALGFNYRYQILGILLTLAIGMGTLQATTTQTDYVSAFFLCAFLYWGLLLARSIRLDWSCVCWGALALGLGFLTKPMIGVFTLPFVIWLTVVFLKKWRYRAVGLGFVFLFFILFLNTPFWLRNYQRCENFLGSQSFIHLVQNEKMSGVFLASNVIRNVATHLALPLANSAFNRSIVFIHQHFLGISSEERAITFGKESYEPFFCINEDCSGNFFVMMLLFFLMGYVLLKMKKLVLSRKYFLIFYFLSLLGGYLLFSFIFKWQPWITRLDLPFFVAAIPFMVVVLHDVYAENGRTARLLNWFLCGLSCYWLLMFAVKDKTIFVALIGLSSVVYLLVVKKLLDNRGKELLIFSAFLFIFPYVYFNSVKPLAWNAKVLLASRERKYFRKNEKAYHAHLKMKKIIEKFDVKSVGILSSGCINEYLLWVVLKNKLDGAITINHLNANEMLAKEMDVFDDHFFLKQCRKYYAIVAYTNDVAPLSRQEGIVLIESLGTPNEPFFLIILKNMKMREVGF